MTTNPILYDAAHRPDDEARRARATEVIDARHRRAQRRRALLRRIARR